MYINHFDTNGSCAEIGYSAEDMFEQWLIQHNRVYRKATLEEQYQHIDFVIEHPETKEIVTVDIKAPKKRNRHDVNTSQDILWVEFVNVIGKDGWLYGNNKYVVFYKSDENCFYSVLTKELANLCENICNQGIAYNSYDALYKKYTRKGRQDVISMIYFSDIFKCESVARIGF
jgi:hypothetical protein